MKNKVLRLSSAVLLTALVSVSLVACGSKKEASSTDSSKASSSVVAKSSSSQKSSKAGSAAQDSASQAVTETDGTTSSVQEGAASTAGQANQASSDQGKQASNAAVPAELVGTWTGTSQQATDVVMTIDAAGNVSTTADYGVDYEDNRSSSTTAKAVKVGDNLYIWEGGDFSTLLPGITGLGGVGQAQPGFILENGQYTPVLFTAGIGQAFDYSNYNAFSFALSKS